MGLRAAFCLFVLSMAVHCGAGLCCLHMAFGSVLVLLQDCRQRTPHLCLPQSFCHSLLVVGYGALFR